MDNRSIRFGRSTGFNLLNPVTKEGILENLQRSYGINPLQRRTDVLSQRNEAKISEMPSLIHVQTQGVPYMMFLTNIGNRQVTLMIERRIKREFKYPKIVLVHVLFSERLFQDTIVTGELVNSNGQWVFLVDDILVYSGQPVMSSMFRERYSILLNILNNDMSAFRYDPFKTVAKRFHQINHFSTVQKELAYLPYNINGVCIRFMGSYRKDLFVQIKIERIPTKVMMIASAAADDGYNAIEAKELQNDNNNNSLNSKALPLHVPDKETSIKLRQLFNGCEFWRRLPLQCIWSSTFEAWQPVFIQAWS